MHGVLDLVLFASPKMNDCVLYCENYYNFTLVLYFENFY